MKKLSKAQLKEKDDRVQALQQAYEKAVDAVGVYNAAVAAAYTELVAAAQQYNDALAEAKAFAERIAQEADEWRSDRSDKWQESDAGNEHQSWVDEWQNWSPDEYEPEEPSTAEEPDDVSGELEALPDEVGGF